NCSDFTIDFTNDSYGTDDYFWNFGVEGIFTDTSSAFEPTYVYPDTGTYTVMLIAFPGEICSDTSYSTVHIYPQLIADFNFESACALQELFFDDASTTDHGYLTEWNWNFGDGSNSSDQNPFHIFDEGGTYSVELKVKNDVGCTENIAQNVLVYPLPEVDFTLVNDCLDELGLFTDISTVDPDYIITDYTWTINNNFLGTDYYATYFFDTTGIYSITLAATTNVLCVDSLTHYIHIDSPLVADVTPDTIICEFDSIQLFARSGITFNWFPDYNITNTEIFNPIIFPAETTTYGVIVCDHCTCDTGYITVEVLPAPKINAAPPDTTVYRYEPVELHAEDAVKYSWIPAAFLTDAQSSDPVSTPANSIEYIVYAVGENGCDNTDTVDINVLLRCNKFTIPNAFTPNGDGLNDTFSVVTSGDDHVPGFTIFNRWGEIVYHSGKLSEPWDGTNNGLAQENGAYIYLITIECEGNYETMTGTVTLIR
ncbi:MAG: gliding motility-associated C-terminal domain-containing protein, partial [Fimbriimonadaceae bacterium]|nr:gliding motility-associated C-terminal domain-containing protein [Chitinophagales bacterium]